MKQITFNRDGFTENRIGFDYADLAEDVKQKVIQEHSEFLIQVAESEEETQFDTDYVIEHIEINGYLFDEDGDLLPIVTHVGKNNEVLKHTFGKNNYECNITDFFSDYPIQDDIWPSRRWNKARTEYIDLGGTTPVKETEPEQPYYKGKGEHSVNQLEAICSQYKEYVSFLNSRGNDTTPTSKEGLTYKVECLDNSTAHYTHDKKEAYEVYAKFIIDFGDAIRLYEAPMPINDHDEIDWETIECYDVDENESKEGLEDGGFTKGEWDIAENKETHHTEYAIKSNGWHIAKLNPYAPENIHAEANARLIAAAPAMYKALKEEIECLEEWNGNGNYTTRIEKIKAILTRINKD